ncbi:unnamed protein product [Cyclocybe aegerita]|uniref:Manganese/iron superoxide dismutase C-terminal domain-containing protein n=1 Tax=Cyclocybe aegerita TaxID=1973307 RepID=A0A8S0XKK3_CYCAE|nr:unnamed protein product [Cyclocybe aegerita]
MASCMRLASSKASWMSSVLSQSRQLASRSLHTRKPLPYPIEGGLGKFLPPPALETLVEYQDGLLERFNEEVRSDPKFERHSTVAQTAIRYSERKERTLAFNYAVLAINNSFFLDRLTPPPPEEAALDTHQDKISDGLAEAIRLNYGDIVRLKSSFSAAALGMFTNGWVWLVTDTGGNLGILPTLGPSTLLIRSRWNLADQRIFREDSDGENSGIASSFGQQVPPGVAPSSPSSGVSSTKPLGGALDPHARAFSSTITGIPTTSIHDGKAAPDEARGPKRNNLATMLSMGDKLYPLFCVPTYEHAWMSAGYGVWGKEEWLKQFWTVLDWEKVSKAFGGRKSREVSFN